MSGQPALGVQRCLGVKKAVKLEKSLGAHQKGINSNQSRGGGWGAVSCLFVCLFVSLFVFRFFSFQALCWVSERAKGWEPFSVTWRSVAFGLLWWFCCVCYSSWCKFMGGLKQTALFDGLPYLMLFFLKQGTLLFSHPVCTSTTKISVIAAKK